MAYQLNAKDVLAAIVLPGAAIGGAGGGTAGRVLGRLGAARTASDVGELPNGPLGPDDIRKLVDGISENEYPKKYHITRVARANGAHNSGLNSVIAREAARMQSLDEHNNALKKFFRPGMTPREAMQALRKGYKEEKKLPAYWDDLQNRRNFNVRSDAVHGIRVTTDGHIEVKWRGSGNWYTFKKFPNTYEASREAQRLIMSDSLGRAVMPYQRNGKMLKFKKPYNYSWWNKANYSNSFAG